MSEIFIAAKGDPKMIADALNKMNSNLEFIKKYGANVTISLGAIRISLSGDVDEPPDSFEYPDTKYNNELSINYFAIIYILKHYNIPSHILWIGDVWTQCVEIVIENGSDLLEFQRIVRFTF